MSKPEYFQTKVISDNYNCRHRERKQAIINNCCYIPCYHLDNKDRACLEGNCPILYSGDDNLTDKKNKLIEIYKKLIANQVKTDPEIEKILHDNSWELYE